MLIAGRVRSRTVLATLPFLKKSCKPKREGLWILVCRWNISIFKQKAMGLFYSYNIFFFFFFLRPHPPHMEVPRPGVKSELQLPAYATATATWDPSHVCDLHHSSRQHRILNPLSKTRDRTCNFMVSSQIRFHCATTGTPSSNILYNNLLQFFPKRRMRTFQSSATQFWSECVCVRARPRASARAWFQRRAGSHLLQIRGGGETEHQIKSTWKLAQETCMIFA